MIVADGAAKTITTPLARDMREAIAVATRKLDAGVIGRPRAVWPVDEAEGVTSAVEVCRPPDPPPASDRQRTGSLPVKTKGRRVFSDEHRAKLRGRVVSAEVRAKLRSAAIRYQARKRQAAA